MADDKIPTDYQWIDWDHLHQYVGRVVTGSHVPRTTQAVAAYLRSQATSMRDAADRLDAAATSMEPPAGRGFS